jgi:DNA-binding beta-propeller fold protein YncE
MLDPNNRPGGPNLILTAKNANKIQFFNASTLALTGEIVMPASTHELVLSPDGTKAYGSIYGGGIFGKNKEPDRRIAVIDLVSKSLERTIDVGAVLAPHSVMMAGDTLWATGELSNVLLAIEPDRDRIERVPLNGSPHWIAVSHATGKIFASFKADHYVAVVDRERRAQVDRIEIPHRAEGLAVSPDGATLYVCAHERNELHEFDARTHARRRTATIEGGDGKNQLKRVRVSPDGRWVLASQNFDAVAVIYEAEGLRAIASIKTKKSPMGFGFAADGKRAYLCCHDDATVLELELSTGRVTREFATDKGCEFVISY